MPRTLLCAECGRACEHGRGWQGHLVDIDDDEQDEVVFFCPGCAEREFAPTAEPHRADELSNDF